MDFKTQMYQRAYASIMKNYASKKGPGGKPGRKPVVFQADLRLECALTATQQFQFYTQRTQGNAFNTENRLDINDGFTVLEMGVFVCKPASLTASNFKLYTYPSSTICTSSNVQTSIDGLYNNGVLNISKTQVNYAQNWGLVKHRYVPVMQDTIAFPNGYTTTGATVIPGTALDSFVGATDTFIPVTPFFSFTGRDNMTINMTTPNPLTNVDAFMRIVLIMRGFIAYNVAR